jgi:hypothetical protein
MPRCAKDSSGRTQQARIWLAESTGSEQDPTVSQLAAADILLFVEDQHTNGTFNSTAQPPRPTTNAPAADPTLTKDVQYSLAPEERAIHELLKPTRPI